MTKRKSGARVHAMQLPTLPDGGNSPCDLIAAWGMNVFEDIARRTPLWSPDASTNPTGNKPVLLRADEVEDKPMEFLCDQRILLRMLTGICGHPGTGKTWVSLKIAADGSRGIDTFSGKKIKAFNTLYWTNESLPETIRRRFKAMSGDLKRLFILTGAVDSSGKPVNLTLANIAELEQAVKASNASLVIVDPLQSFLGAKVDMNQANQTRPLLDGLSALADKHRMAVIVVRHLAKASTSHAIGRALGSIDITAKFRTEYLVGETQDGSRIQAFAHLKYGELQRQESIKFIIEGKNSDARLIWQGSISLTAQEMLASETPRTRKKSDIAADYLFDALEKGPCDPKELEANSPVSRATLHRAARELGICMDGAKKKRQRLWTMPKFGRHQRREDRVSWVQQSGDIEILII